MEPKIKWTLKGKWIKNCNCDPGCPCDFWSKPTHTTCEGMLGMIVEEGFFGNIPMNGVTFVVLYKWPGPLHEGNGTVQPFFDEKTTQAQRDALVQILMGKAGNPWFEVVSSLISKVLEPKVVDIEFVIDVENVTSKVVIPGIMETQTKPIKNIATNEDHRILVNLPNGMEYKTAETGTAVINKATGLISFNWPMSHSSLAYVEQTELGLKAR